MAIYRVRYKNAQASGSNIVLIDVQIDYSADDGATWDPLDSGTTQIGIPAADVLAITRDPELTDQQKLSGLNALLQQRIDELGLTDSREALGDIEALVPSWPITVAL